LLHRSVCRGRAGLRQGRSASGFSRSSSGPDEFGPGCRTQRRNTHGTEEREVLYRWHPWFGRLVWVHKEFEKQAREVLRCSLDCGESARSLELPAWMFDRAACASIRLATTAQVSCAALLALQSRLAVALGELCRKDQPDSPVSGAGEGSCPQNREAAHARKARHSKRPRACSQTAGSARSAATCGGERARLEPAAGPNAASRNQVISTPPPRSRPDRVQAGRRKP
jgi:hypothetical protein